MRESPPSLPSASLPLDLPNVLIFAAAVAGGAFLQGVVGFAFVLVTTPLLLKAGMPLQQTVAVGATCIMLQTAVACWQTRREIPWREVMRVLVPRMIGLPIGIWLLTVLAASSPDRIKQVVGCAVLLAVGLMLLVRPKPKQHVPATATVAAGGSSGLLAGLVGMGGPPLVLWTALHPWSTRRSRAFLWASFLLVAPPQLGLLAWNYPHDTGQGMLFGVVGFPLIAGFSYLGVRAGDFLPRRWLRRAMFSLLAVIGVLYATAPWW